MSDVLEGSPYDVLLRLQADMNGLVERSIMRNWRAEQHVSALQDAINLVDAVGNYIKHHGFDGWLTDDNRRLVAVYDRVMGRKGE